MAELKRVEEKYEQVERVITEDVLVRPAGYELFLTKSELRGLRTLLGMGCRSATLKALDLENLWSTASTVVGPDWSVTFSNIARVQGQ